MFPAGIANLYVRCAALSRSSCSRLVLPAVGQPLARPTVFFGEAQRQVSQSTPATSGRAYEEAIARQIKDTLGATDCKVVDQSGGCGQSFAISVTAPCFEGKSRLMKQRMVQGVIREEIAKWHAVTISTH